MKNAHLWKRILHEGIAVGDRMDPDIAVQMQARIMTLPIIVGSVVTSGEIWYDSFKSLAIPFDAFWIESPVEDVPYCIGAVVEVERMDDRFVLHVLYFKSQNGHRPEYIAHADHRVSPDGDFLAEGAGDGSGRRGMPVWPNPSIPREHFGSAAMNVYFGMLLENLQLLGCKNVSLAPRRQTDAKAVKEATRRNGGHAAGYRYHVLVVRPAGAKSDAPAQEIGNMPRHVCRGHFAEYGPKYGKGLLFGRLEGRFYIPPHLKGDAKNGIVEKDYEVRA